MKALYYFPVALITAYLVITILAFGRIPKSISDTYYQWKDKPHCKFLFTFVMWLTGFPILIYWISVTKEPLQFIPFLSISGMLFVGAACAFKETLTRGVHFTSAGIWSFFALLYFVLVKDWTALLSGAIIFVLVALVADRKHFTFWAEVSCIAVMMIGIFRL